MNEWVRLNEGRSKNIIVDFRVMLTSINSRVAAKMSMYIWMMNLWVKNILGALHMQEQSLSMLSSKVVSKHISSLKNLVDSISWRMTDIRRI